jgi:hypothetical protein
MSETTAPKTRFPGEYSGLGIVLLVAGVILAVVGGLLGGGIKDLSKAYFFGWLFWTFVTLGCTGLAILHHVVRAKWSAAMFRIWEAGGGWQMLTLMGLGFLPVAFVFAPNIYKWMDKDYRQADKILKLKEPFLTPEWYTIYGIVFFIILALIMHRLSGLMAQEEKSGDKKWSDKRNWFAPPMLVVYVLLITFATTYWGMTLDPHWFSTIYPIWLMNGMGIAALSFGLMTICTQAEKTPFKELLTRPLIKDIGHMLLALSMVWAYFSLSQYLIIWSGNLPEFTPYYLARGMNGWAPVGLANIIGTFVLPFLLLVGPYSPWLKARPVHLAWIAGWCFVFRIVDFHYIISPSLHPGSSAAPILGDFGLLLAVGGIWLVAFSAIVKTKPLTSHSHPYQAFQKDQEVNHAIA